MSKTASIARAIQGFERSAFIVFFAMLGLIACGEEPAPQEYNLCDSDADCSEVTPRCRALDLSASGNAAKICVSECDPNEDTTLWQCPSSISKLTYPTIPYACVGVNEDGHLDRAASDGVCARLCKDPGELPDGPSDYCWLSRHRDERREGSAVCALLGYDEYSGPLAFCLEPGTPQPPPIVPLYSECSTDSGCSELTPECRFSRLPGRDRVRGGVCTLPCETDEDCPIDPHISVGPMPGRCLGVDAEGLIDLESDDKICFPGCAGDACIRGAGTPEQVRGYCDYVDPEGTEELGLFCF